MCHYPIFAKKENPKTHTPLPSISPYNRTAFSLSLPHLLSLFFVSVCRFILHFINYNMQSK